MKKKLLKQENEDCLTRARLVIWLFFCYTLAAGFLTLTACSLIGGGEPSVPDICEDFADACKVKEVICTMDSISLDCRKATELCNKARAACCIAGVELDPPCEAPGEPSTFRVAEQDGD